MLLSEKVHTIMFDNGKEFAFYACIKEVLGSDNYFAYPYDLWERGLNENHNGLICQYLSKGMALGTVGIEKVTLSKKSLTIAQGKY